MSSPRLLELPTELRYEIYETYLEYHRHVRYLGQPTNQHLRLLLTSKQIYLEAGPILRRYVSFLHERQIAAFIKCDAEFARVTHADVANDGRLVHPAIKSEELHPLSQLYIALRLLPSLQYLRVFECRQGLPFTTKGNLAAHLLLESEQAMFPTKIGPDLKSYELMMLPETRVRPLSVLRSGSLQTLRLSGHCILPPTSPMPHLKNLYLHGVDGNFFDRRAFTECFPEMHQLEVFSYSLRTNIGFELRNRHLESLVECSGHSLRTLVLLECNRLTSTVIADCLAGLPNLEYFVLSLITVEELRTNFLLSLPEKVQVLKIQVGNAWYAVSLREEESRLCDTMEQFLGCRPFHTVVMKFRDSVFDGPRTERCRRIALNRGISFSTDFSE